MGKGWEGIAASSRSSESNGLGTCEAHDVGFSPEEDRGRSKSEMGTGEGGKEEIERLSRLGVACCGEFAVGFCVWVTRSTLCVAKLLES